MLKPIFKPFNVISEKPSEFITWFLFTVITGQLGIIANLIIRSYSHDVDLIQSIFIDSQNGIFYTFSIALSASLLGPLFINFLKEKEQRFRTIKTFTLIGTVFFLIISGYIYAAVQSKNFNYDFKENLTIDPTQICIYILAIFIVSYGFCVLRLDESDLDFDDIDHPDYSKKDDENVEEISEQVEETETISSNGKTIKL